MCGSGANDRPPTTSASGAGPGNVGDTSSTCSTNDKIEIVAVTVHVDAVDNNVIMNDPAAKVLVSATVTYKASCAADALDRLPEVCFTFGDGGASNTEKTASFQYSAKFLGKRADANAVFWSAHDGFTTSSDNAYKANAKVEPKTTSGKLEAITKVWFLPSGVGGDKFRVKATIFKPGGTTQLTSKESAEFLVWRALRFDKIYEMQGETHVSTNATTAKISPVFDPAFVKYTAGARTQLAATYSVDYIGLWGGTATPQEAWATVQAKKPAEIPSASEIADATYAGTDVTKLAARATARTAILAKAQAWTDRIDAAFSAARDRWVADAGIPDNAIVAIRYYHPKYSDLPAGQTHEWRLGGASTPAWLRVGAFPKSGGGYNYSGLDPDHAWAGWAGLSHGNGRVTVPKGRPDAAITQTIRHEAGHATQSHFKRADFGPSLDHSASNAGIMYYSSAMGGTTFSPREQKVLRGIKVPP